MFSQSASWSVCSTSLHSVCQVHGFPKIIGVLTHLDGFRHNKRLQKTKKRLKQRFWAEIYHGAKLFYLSRVVRGRYPKRVRWCSNGPCSVSLARQMLTVGVRCRARMEVHNVARFIGVMKNRPLTWRNTHPYVLIDRWEDTTGPWWHTQKMCIVARMPYLI